VVLSLDNIESIKRYVEIGLGLAVAVDFAVRPEDHDHVGIVRLDHLFPGSVIGICTLKGKFVGQGVRNFIQMMTEYMSGYHTELWEAPLPVPSRQTPPIIDDA
jgi:DNA-binding transcriptional LysR family regulator